MASRNLRKARAAAESKRAETEVSEEEEEEDDSRSTRPRNAFDLLADEGDEQCDDEEDSERAVDGKVQSHSQGHIAEVCAPMYPTNIYG